METAGEGAQVQIRFVTKQQQYAVPNFPLSVPSESPVTELNALVNELLKESNDQKKTIEFDFLVNSEFLRTTLKEHIAEREISCENVIDIEYIEKHPPPEPQDCLIHDDWVSAVAMQDKWILSGCYDNTLHIWTAKGAHHLNIPVYHTAAIKSVAWISMDNESATFVSASQDQTAVIWKWDISSNSVEIVGVCKGHERGLERVGVNTSNNLMATGAWDTMLKIWSSYTVVKTQFTSHSSWVSAVSWSATDEHLFLSGAYDNQVKLWDTRSPKAPLFDLSGHEDKVLCCNWSNPKYLISGGADNTVRIFKSKHAVH
ncbi:unnamed protein product [Trichogramma brassicae]|uniref:NLE domain-containing protein n=1 Tax=Trichogramma brassicae TaxID=86971 RepID=A0A6H5IQN9_9HYME|nr:unnamed protein product [Trichogramma brassicae]